MARRDPSHLVVGYLNRPHGVDGEILVSPLTDHPESVFASGVILSLGDKDADDPDPDLPPLRVESTRPSHRGILVSFGGVEDRDQARFRATLQANFARIFPSEQVSAEAVTTSMYAVMAEGDVLSRYVVT